MELGFSTAAKKVVEIQSVQDLTSRINSGSPVLVDFTASWCGPCRMLAPILDKLSSEHATVDFVKVDIDTIPELARKHNITSVPFVAFYRNGKQLGSFVGARDQTFITKFIKENME